MVSQSRRNLVKALNKLVKQERWRKIPKAQGEVIEKKFTKSFNLGLTIKTKKRNIIVYILKRNKNLYEDALKIENGDFVSMALRTQLGKYYCVKLTRKKEKQLKNWFT